MGNEQSIKQRYEKYHITPRLYNYIVQFQSWLQSCNPHPYYKTIRNLFDRVCNNLLTYKGLVSSDTEFKIINKLKEIEKIIEKHPICNVRYMDKTFVIQSNLNNKMFIQQSNIFTNINDLIQTLEYPDYSEIRFEFPNKMVAFNQIQNPPSELSQIVNKAYYL